MSRYSIIWFLFASLCHVVFASNSCITRVNCQQCIADPSECAWCAMNDFNGTRCQPAQKVGWCPEQLQNPINERKVTEEQDFSSVTGNVIQIKPQQYKMKLRPGVSQDFQFSFQGAEDYPVDLYFLIDASSTMEDIKSATAYQSANIYKTFKNITKNVHLGFGTFVEKQLSPFSFLDQKTYSFHHKLTLMDNFTRFQDELLNTPNSANRDNPEGGLDALAQVMVCKEIIKWRNESRKIVVFMTDDPYHAAGDGKSAGVVQPYDGKCYTENNTYIKEQVMDYPSVGMINKLADENNIIVFFFVFHEQHATYFRLSEVISGSRISTFTKKGAQDDSIVTTLKEIYEEISKKIVLKVKTKANNLKITFNPECTSDTSGSECDVEIGHEKQLTGLVTLLKYDGQNNINVDIVIESIGEKLSLDIEVIKNCECEKHVTEKSDYCSFEKRSCGLCECGAKRYGERCACLKSDDVTINNSTCIPPDGNEICNDRGTCKCGTCRCRAGFEGKFCECNSQSCERDSKGVLCGGHGECFCGQCACEGRWVGKACDCNDEPSRCVRDGKVCNNRGYCLCGGCKCQKIAKWDSRNVQDAFCKVLPCPDCHNSQCRALESCATCIRRNDDCLGCHDHLLTRVVQTLPKEYYNSSAWHICESIKAATGCYTSFAYRYIDENYTLELVAQQDMDCAKNYYLFGGLCLLLLLLLGLGTLVTWKLMTNYRDRMEYLDFAEKNKNSEQTFNPLYTAPTTTFDNPGFRKRSLRQ
ncbi:integrin beta-6-like [Anticarsia gemmatalis]|uniref:integrin beta-6-like n=1 Tax=Anticarsia gemmatalis TaxID=129554 RepID=UPI003F75E7D8